MIKNLRYLVDTQQFEKLHTTLENILKNKKDLTLLPLFAISCAHKKEYKKAFEICKECEESINDLDLEALVDLAGAYCLLWRVNEAIELLETIVKKNSTHSLCVGRLAWCYWQEDKIDEAISLYEQSININPNRIPFWSGLAKLYIEQKQLTKATTTIDKALEYLDLNKQNMPLNAIDIFEEQFEELRLDIWCYEDNIAKIETWLVNQQILNEEKYSKKVIMVSVIFAHHNKHQEAQAILKEALKIYVNNKELILQLAQFANIEGHSVQEINLINRAIKLSSEDDNTKLTLLISLANAFLHIDDNKALEAINEAQNLIDEIKTTIDKTQIKLQIKTILANIQNQMKEYNKAQTLYQEVLSENPYLISALQGYGGQLMELGKIDEAIVLYERLQQVDPMTGLSALINARKFPEDKETLLKLEKLANKPTLEGDVRTSILFQLASAWEKLKEYDKAFEVITTANKAVVKHLKYSKKEHRQYCARLRYAFCKDLYKHRPNYGVNSSIPVFVLGMPRSGTTLVEQIIASHSEIFGAGELGIIPQIIQGLNRWEIHTGSGRKYPDVIDDLDEIATKGIANGILNELKELAIGKPNAKYVVDKLPHNFENIGLIKFLFPNAKIISIRRDPRDIAISNYFQNFQAKHGGMGFAYDLESIGEQLADHNLLMRHWHTIFDDILEINYEDVVDDLKTSARKMLNYIGVEWEDGVLEYNKLDRAVKTASLWQVRQPIYKTAVQKWKRYEKYLAPLIKGTNAKIEWDAINDMITLPIAGYLSKASQLYKNGDLEGAEKNCKMMLHYNSEHAGCNYILGLVYLSKNYINDGITHLEKALKKVPWQKEWRDNLIKAYEITGQLDKIKEMKEEKN